MTITRKEFLFGGVASVALAAFACTDDGGGRTTLDGSSGPDGDGDPSAGDGDPGDGDPGDGDPGDGDPGDGDPGDGDPGDGDGDPGDGDPGDGDPGDGDPGDGDPGDGDPGDGDGDPDPVCPQGASGNIQTNHSHSLVIPQADVIAAVQKIYNIQGGANHNHTVTVTPADFNQLALGNSVQKDSSFLMGHAHVVIIGCLL